MAFLGPELFFLGGPGPRARPGPRAGSRAGPGRAGPGAGPGPGDELYSQGVFILGRKRLVCFLHALRTRRRISSHQF